MEAKPRNRRKSERIKDMMRDLRRKDRNLGLGFRGEWRGRGDGGREVAWWGGMGGVFGIFFLLVVSGEKSVIGGRELMGLI
ncbi:hypothetical protein LguiB_024317 [Lonicera macranthoides]